jgi:PAS domain S-box-containing protein
MLRILVIDDQVEVRTAIAMILRLNGFEAVIAESGAAGLSEFGRIDCDLAIVDMFLGGQPSGVAVMRSLRQQTPTLPIIAISGTASLDLLAEYPDLPGVKCLPKPFRPNDLMDAIELAFPGRQLSTTKQAVSDEYRERLFAAAIESSDDAIVTKSLDGVITGWNQAAQALFGFTSQEAIGQSIDLVVPTELRPEARAILGKIRNGEKVSHHDTVRVAKDGHRINVSLSVSPIKSQSGVIIGAAKVARDNAVRIQEQKALQESEQMAQAIIESSLDAFVQLDERGTIIRWSANAEAMLGWPRADAVGRNLRDLIIPESGRAGNLQRMNEFLQEFEKGLPGRRYESPSLRRDGTEILTEVSLTALRRDHGYIINGFLRDITERRAAEEQLRQAQKMESVGQLTGGIAHDFNNMLTVITGTIAILAMGVEDRPDLAAIAKLISDAADRGTELTSRLLAFSRQQSLQPNAVDINKLTTEVARLLNPTLGEQIEVRLALASDLCPALIDPNQLSAAILNLAINARDAMPAGGKLTIETSNAVFDDDQVKSDDDIEPGNYVLIAVSDTGTGIPEALLTKVFEPFFSTKEVGSGTGLGLSMVYGFVKQSGGQIRIYSEEGKGTTFKIYLPQANQAPVQIAGSPHEEVEGGTETILTVEDNENVRAYVVTQLRSLGYNVLTAANAAEALAIVDNGAPFDLLFTDVIMPGQMNGRQLAQAVAQRRPSINVLFTSGYAQNAISHHGRLDPGVLLLSKPYRRRELARMLRIALEQKGAIPSI